MGENREARPRSTPRNRIPADPSVSVPSVYWRFVRRRSWLLAFGLTVLGMLIVVPLLKPLDRIIVVAPVTYLLLVLVLRLSARYGEMWLPAAGGPGRDRLATDTLAEQAPGIRLSDQDEAYRRRRTVFAIGAVLLGCISLATLALWLGNRHADTRPDLLTWILLLGMSFYAVRLVVLFRPARLYGPLWKLDMAQASVTPNAVSAMCWVAVSNMIIIATCGMVLGSMSGQFWRLVPFAALAIATGVASWLRLGQVIKAL